MSLPRSSRYYLRPQAGPVGSRERLTTEQGPIGALGVSGDNADGQRLGPVVVSISTSSLYTFL